MLKILTMIGVIFVVFSLLFVICSIVLANKTDEHSNYK